MKCSMIATGVVLAAMACGAYADDGGGNTFKAKLGSYQETPAISSAARGSAVVKIDDVTQTISYEVTFEGLEGNISQSHIHFGQPGVAGGIMLWLCGTATNPGPTGTPPCPASGTFTGLLLPANIVGPTGQGVVPTEFAEAARAIRAGVTYVNVHSAKFAGGEIRGVLKRASDKGDRDND